MLLLITNFFKMSSLLKNLPVHLRGGVSSFTFGTISLGSCFFISFPSLLNKTSLIFGGEYKNSFV
jgi:hypothetical protein